MKIKMKFYINCFIVFLFLHNSMAIALTKQNTHVKSSSRIINLDSLNSFFTEEIQQCANWDLSKDEVELFFNELSLPIENPPISRVPLSCSAKGELKFKNKLWSFEINAGGFGELHSGTKRLFFTCGYYANANIKCEKFFIRVPESYENDLDTSYETPPLFSK